MAVLSHKHDRSADQRGYGWLFLVACSLFSLLLMSCSGSGGDTNSKKSTPTPSAVKSAQLKWCSKPQMVFRDEASTSTPSATSTAAATTTLPPANGTPTAISDWSVFKANVGFPIFLPETLPSGTCLVSAFGTLRDPIFGGNFTIGYQLPNNDAISLSEAPLRSQSTTFQCSVDTSQANSTVKEGTATPTSQIPIQLCSGVRETTNIVFSARGATGDLQNFFNKLRADVEWIPAA